MTLAECRELKKGDQVYVKVSRNTYQYMTFLKMQKVTKFGKMTFSDLMNGKFDLSKGKDVWEAECEFIDDRGRTKSTYVGPRALHKD